MILVLVKLDKGCCVYKYNLKRQREWKSLLLRNHDSESTLICNVLSLYRNVTLQTWVYRNWLLGGSVRDYVPLLSDFFIMAFVRFLDLQNRFFLVIKPHNLPSSYTHTPSFFSRFFFFTHVNDWFKSVVPLWDDTCFSEGRDYFSFIYGPPQWCFLCVTKCSQWICIKL